MKRTIIANRATLSVLGLDEKGNYTEEELKAAYRRQVKLLHPDAGGNAERFRELHDTYASLRMCTQKKVSSPDLGQSNPFYNNAHSRWSGGRHHGEAGLGAAFARCNSGDYSSTGHDDFNVGWDDGKQYANSSTRDFYRPYTSNPFAHGFTEEEVLEAERLNRLRVLWAVLKHGLLWWGLLYLLFVCWCESRIQRAIDARNVGYADASYWEKLKHDEQRGLSTAVRPHWTDAQHEEFMQAWNKHFGDRRWQSPFFGGMGAYGSRPVVLTFKGRPFTPTGVRGARTGVPKTQTTYEDDVHCELDDVEND